MQLVGGKYFTKKSQASVSTLAEALGRCKGLGKFGNVSGWHLPDESELKAFKPPSKAWASSGKVWNGSAFAMVPKADPTKRPPPKLQPYGVFCVAKKK